MIDELQEQPQEQEPQEVRIGMAKLLGILIALVIVCAMFFSLGYSLGKKSVAATLIPEPTATAASSKPKPSPLPVRPATDQAPPTSSPAPANSAGSDSAAAANQPDSHAKPSPELATAGGTYVVQVAAVSRQEDAEALVNALRKKDYPVFVVNNGPADKLFHVQIGPYAEMKDAEAMKARLAGDGYNPIVKK